MNKIWKYTLQILDEQTMKLPVHAKILCAKGYQGELVLYAVINDQYTEVDNRIIRILGTDHPFPDFGNCIYIGTVALGPCVWHVFEKKEKGGEMKKK